MSMIEHPAHYCEGWKYELKEALTSISAQKGICEMGKGNIYVIKDDGSKELLCSADLDGCQEITKDSDAQEYISSPIMQLPTELSFTVNMGREQCRQFHDVISTLPIPKAKRNDKIRRSFAESIQKFGKRRKK